RDAFGGWFEVDPDLKLNWYNDNTNDPEREIRRSKNLKSLTYTPSYTQIVNRVYAYGKGESDARITLLDAGEAHEYIEDATSQATYGIMAKRYVDKSITHPTTLLKYAQRILAQYKTPPYQYSVDVVNLAEVRDYDYSLESLGLDTRVRVIDDLLSVDVNTSIVSMSIDLLSPADITIELSTVKTDLSDIFKDIISTQNINQSVATQISAGQVTVLGTFVVKDWVTDGETTIDGGNITANTITVDQIQSGVLGNKTYRQAAEPASPSSGDIWIDSDDGNLMYRYDGSAWVVTQDAEIGDAISAAATAQSTAEGKITTFFQDAIPVSLAIGDLWVDTNDDNKLYRAESIGADAIAAGEWVIARDNGIAQAISDASGAQSTADSKVVTFAQAGIPTSTDIGDLWIDTDDKNKLYRAESIGADAIAAGKWVIVRDADIAQALSDAAQAISDASTAQATADGKVTTFYQIGEPTAEGIGDLWIDTDDGNKLYRWSGSAWTEIQDAGIASAIADAATAQTTADGKIVSFYQDSAPTAEGVGDLWTDTNDDNKLYRWSGSAWISVRDAGIASALSDAAQAISDASTAQATADGKVTTFYQDSEPTADGIGDLWIFPALGNLLYRWSGSAWTEIQDAGIASAIADAATAQTTADGKIVSFYQDSAPTAEGVGDIWFDTDAGNKQYWWNGTAWVASSITPAQTIATINLDGGTVQINGSQISINGDTTFSTGYDPTTKIASGGAATDINNNTTTISGGKITTNTIAANALTTSTMTARTITLSGADSILQGNYTAGSAGWQIKGDGNAEFNNISLRGTLYTSSIASGNTITVVGKLKSNDYSPGSAGWKIDGVGNAEFNNATIRGTLKACTIASGETLTVSGTIVMGNRLYFNGNTETTYLWSDGYDMLFVDGFGVEHKLQQAY
ncbi:MAG: phage tail protein, partial [Proteiniphilum sp.]|nr:phage tail protein [Proteiniphilum sp.]